MLIEVTGRGGRKLNGTEQQYRRKEGERYRPQSALRVHSADAEFDEADADESQTDAFTLDSELLYLAHRLQDAARPVQDDLESVMRSESGVRVRLKFLGGVSRIVEYGLGGRVRKVSGFPGGWTFARQDNHRTPDGLWLYEDRNTGVSRSWRGSITVETDSSIFYVSENGISIQESPLGAAIHRNGEGRVTSIAYGGGLTLSFGYLDDGDLVAVEERFHSAVRDLRTAWSWLGDRWQDDQGRDWQGRMEVSPDGTVSNRDSYRQRIRLHDGRLVILNLASRIIHVEDLFSRVVNVFEAAPGREAVWSFEHGPEGTLVAWTEPSGRTWQRAGERWTSSDGSTFRGDVTTDGARLMRAEWSGSVRRVTERLFATGEQRSYHYEEGRRLLAVTDAEGRTWHLQESTGIWQSADADGYITSWLPSQARITRDPQGLVCRVVYPNGRSRQFFYEPGHRDRLTLQRFVEPDGEVWHRVAPAAWTSSRGRSCVGLVAISGDGEFLFTGRDYVQHIIRPEGTWERRYPERHAADVPRLFEKNLARLDRNGDGRIEASELQMALRDPEFTGEDAYLVLLLLRLFPNGVTHEDMSRFSAEHWGPFDRGIQVADKTFEHARRLLESTCRTLWGTLLPQEAITEEAVKAQMVRRDDMLEAVAQLARRCPEVLHDMLVENPNGTVTVTLPVAGRGVVNVAPLTEAELATYLQDGRWGVWIAVLLKAFDLFSAGHDATRRIPLEQGLRRCIPLTASA